MAKKRKVEVEEEAPEDIAVQKEDEENENSEADGSSEAEVEEDEEDMKKLLEPFSKEQLMDIISENAKKDPQLLENIRKLADKDPAHRKIFVRGLGWDTTSEILKSVFSQYGELEECTVIVDKGTGKSKGYGFVTFKHMEGAQKALKEPSKKIDSRMTACQMASAGPAPAHPPTETTGRKIYVSNVPADIPAEKLLNFFSKYGEVEEGPLGFDKQTGKSRGFALFIYKTVEGAKKALEEPNKSVEGHSMNCKRAAEGSKQRNTHAPVTGPLDPNDLALTHGAGSILGSAAAAHGVLGSTLPFNQGGAPGFSQAFNAILAGQNQNFPGLNHSLFTSVNPALASSFNPSSLSQAAAFSPSVQSSLGSVGSYGVHPSLGAYGSQHGGVGSVNPGVLGVYGSQAAALQGLNAYQSSQLGQSPLPRTSQSGGGSLAGMPPYLQR